MKMSVDAFISGFIACLCMLGIGYAVGSSRLETYYVGERGLNYEARECM